MKENNHHERADKERDGIALRIETGQKKRQRRALPGLPLTLGITISYLCLIVLIPVTTIFVESIGLGWAGFIKAGFSTRVLASYRLSFGTALGAALINLFFGLLLAWVLVRYRFPGKRFIEGMIDLPFALPTAVAGIALTAIYSRNGWMGRWLEELGIKVAFTPLGIGVALVFIGLPFVVRTVQPVIEDLDLELEEAAAMLGASRWRTFRSIIFPVLLPALLTGFALSFARGMGEYGSVVFISGNMPMRTEISPLLIVTKLEQYDYAGATSIALVMLIFSFLLLLAINLLQRWSRLRIGN